MDYVRTENNERGPKEAPQPEWARSPPAEPQRSAMSARRQRLLLIGGHQNFTGAR